MSFADALKMADLNTTDSMCEGLSKIVNIPECRTFLLSALIPDFQECQSFNIRLKEIIIRMKKKVLKSNKEIKDLVTKCNDIENQNKDLKSKFQKLEDTLKSKSDELKIEKIKHEDALTLSKSRENRILEMLLKSKLSFISSSECAEALKGYYDERIKDLNKENRASKEALVDSGNENQSRLDDLMNKLSLMDKEIVGVTEKNNTESKKYELQIKSLQDKNDQLEAENELAKENYDSQLLDLMLKSAKLQSEVSSLNEKLTELSKSACDVESRHKLLQDEKSEWEQKAHDMQQNEIEAFNFIVRSKENIKSAHSFIEIKMGHLIRSYTEKIYSLEQKNSALEDSLKQSKSKVKKCLSEFEKCQVHIESLQRRSKMSQIQLIEIQRSKDLKNEELAAQKDKLVHFLAASKSQARSTSSLLEKLKIFINELSVRYKLQSDHLNALHEMHDCLKSEKQELIIDLADYRQKFSDRDMILKQANDQIKSMQGIMKAQLETESGLKKSLIESEGKSKHALFQYNEVNEKLQVYSHLVLRSKSFIYDLEETMKEKLIKEKKLIENLLHEKKNLEANICILLSALKTKEKEFFSNLSRAKFCIMHLKDAFSQNLINLNDSRSANLVLEGNKKELETVISILKVNNDRQRLFLTRSAHHLFFLKSISQSSASELSESKKLIHSLEDANKDLRKSALNDCQLYQSSLYLLKAASSRVQVLKDSLAEQIFKNSHVKRCFNNAQIASEQKMKNLSRDFSSLDFLEKKEKAMLKIAQEIITNLLQIIKDYARITLSKESEKRRAMKMSSFSVEQSCRLLTALKGSKGMIESLQCKLKSDKEASSQSMTKCSQKIVVLEEENVNLSNSLQMSFEHEQKLSSILHHTFIFIQNNHSFHQQHHFKTSNANRELLYNVEKYENAHSMIGCRFELMKRQQEQSKLVIEKYAKIVDQLRQHCERQQKLLQFKDSSSILVTEELKESKNNAHKFFFLLQKSKKLITRISQDSKDLCAAKINLAGNLQLVKNEKRNDELELKNSLQILEQRKIQIQNLENCLAQSEQSMDLLNAKEERMYSTIERSFEIIGDLKECLSKEALTNNSLRTDLDGHRSKYSSALYELSLIRDKALIPFRHHLMAMNEELKQNESTIRRLQQTLSTAYSYINVVCNHTLISMHNLIDYKERMKSREKRTACEKQKMKSQMRETVRTLKTKTASMYKINAQLVEDRHVLSKYLSFFLATDHRQRLLLTSLCHNLKVTRKLYFSSHHDYIHKCHQLQTIECKHSNEYPMELERRLALAQGQLVECNQMNVELMELVKIKLAQDVDGTVTPSLAGNEVKILKYINSFIL